MLKLSTRFCFCFAVLVRAKSITIHIGPINIMYVCFLYQNIYTHKHTKFPPVNMSTPTQIHIHPQTRHKVHLCMAYQITRVKSKPSLSKLETPWSCSHFHIIAKSWNIISNIITWHWCTNNQTVNNVQIFFIPCTRVVNELY